MPILYFAEAEVEAEPAGFATFLCGDAAVQLRVGLTQAFSLASLSCYAVFVGELAGDQGDTKPTQEQQKCTYLFHSVHTHILHGLRRTSR